ncbi:MAG: beta-N-acetylhexosaminidase, partial [Clostridiales bacterium]|nr:beta-N-acetylhexosaminidase [Clostridiales bacterium]
MKRKLLSALTVCVMVTVPLFGCSGASSESLFPTEDSDLTMPSTDVSESSALPSWDEGITAEEVLASLTLEQKASQMVQAQLRSLSNTEMEENCYSSMFSTKDEHPAVAADNWMNRIRNYQRAALASEAGIPFIYGQDSVHGVNTAGNAIIYPHNINIGAANDPELTYEYGRLVGSDMKHTGMIWNFGPVVTDSQDPRWGRTYESLSSDLSRLTPLASAYIRGQLDEGVISCPKHFFAEGSVVFGTGEVSDGTTRLIDRGDSRITDEARINELLDVYRQMIETGAQTIMISHASLNGVKMHENGQYIMKLKDDFGFEGFIVSDYNSLHNCSGGSLYDNVVLAVNAGIDMLMEP